MSFLKSALKLVAEAALQQYASSSSQQTQGTGRQSGEGSFRYVGQVEGAQGVVQVQVTRIHNQYQNVFRINGVLTTPAGQWRFDVDGHSGYGKLHDESIVYMEIDEQNLSLTINPYDPPAPTYHFRRA